MISSKLKLPKIKNEREYYEILAVRTLGNFLVLGSLLLILKTVYQPALAELTFFWDDIHRTTYAVAPVSSSTPTSAPGGFAKLFQTQRVELLVPADPAFSLVIPKIGANAPIVKNVDPGDETAYLAALQKGIAHAQGTSFPGEGGHIFLFAHSTDYIWNIGSYNAVFYLLYKLDIGDEISVFYQNERYTYIVAKKELINPDQTDYLTRKTNTEELTLQTCWPPGTTLKRLIISANKK